MPIGSRLSLQVVLPPDPPAIPGRRVVDVNRAGGDAEALEGAPWNGTGPPHAGNRAALGPKAMVSRASMASPPAPAHPPQSLAVGSVALLSAVAVSFIFRRRRHAPVRAVERFKSVEAPKVEAPKAPTAAARTRDSMEPSDAWVPDSIEVQWLQAFFGIEEEGYGLRTQAAVKQLQERYSIPVDPQRMIGPKTYQALWVEHLSLVHRWWHARAQGDQAVDLALLLASPMPLDLRVEVERLHDGYARYWAAVEGRYQAILRQDSQRATAWEEEIHQLQGLGVQLGEIPVLDNRYLSMIEALYRQADKVRTHPHDGEYARMLAMLDAAQGGKWDKLPEARATFSGWWTAFWRWDRAERAHAARVVDFLAPYRRQEVRLAEPKAMAPPVAAPSAVPPTGEVMAAQVPEDPFWELVGPAPVVVQNGKKEFAPHFANWADEFNAMVAGHWRGRTTDHAGTPADRLISTYQLTPEKVERLWEAARQNHVDPRLLLAILVQEGTGSFDTNHSNAGAYLNGNGPQPDWAKDLEAAFDGLILAKLRLYPAAVKGGFPGDWVDYVNWYTPIDRVKRRTGQAGESGVYAEDIFWARGVRRIYVDIARELDPNMTDDPVQSFSQWMVAHAHLFKPRHIQGEFHIRPGNPSGVEAAVHASYYDPEKYPGGYHRNGVKSWYFFPAPEWYVWMLAAGSPLELAPTPGAVQYQVPLLKQQASSWRDTWMAPTGVKASQPATVGHYGCAVTAAAMSLQYLGIQTDPNDIVVRARRNDAAAQREGRQNGRLGMDSVWELHWYRLAQEFPGVRAWDAAYAGLEQLRRWLTDGPVILGGIGPQGSHFVVVTGYMGDGTSLADFRINDPGANRKTLADFAQAYPNLRWVRQFTKEP